MDRLDTQTLTYRTFPAHLAPELSPAAKRIRSLPKNSGTVLRVFAKTRGGFAAMLCTAI